MNPVLAAASAILRGRDRATSVLTVIAFALPHAVFLAVLGGEVEIGRASCRERV